MVSEALLDVETGRYCFCRMFWLPKDFDALMIFLKYINFGKLIHEYTRSRNYLLHFLQTYVKKELKSLFKKSIFRKLLSKLTEECVFSVNNWLIKQTDDCPVGRPISAAYVCKMEGDIVQPSKRIFFKYCVYDTYIRRKKSKSDKLYNILNWNHQNKKLTVEWNPTKFLDVAISQSTASLQLNCPMNMVLYIGYQKSHWHTNAMLIIGELNRAKKIASHFKIKRIVKIYSSRIL